jgi:two-component sensor histidine kinase/PAS domain-containing protein
VRYCGSLRCYHPGGQPIAPTEAPLAGVLRTGTAARDVETVIEQPNGRRLAILANIDPLFDRLGNIAGAVSCFQDVSVLKQAQQIGERREARMRELLEALPAAVYTTDAEGRITFFNEAAAQLWDHRPTLSSSSWCGSWRLRHPDGSPLAHDACPMAIAIKETRAIRGAEAMAERPDGTRVPFLAYPTPLRDADGRLTGAVNMLVDISERKRAEEKQQKLLNELNHRVKNTLATVQSLARQTLRGCALDEGVRDAFEARIFALSRVHDRLNQGCWLSADFEAIVADALAAFREGGGANVEVCGQPLSLPPKSALMLAMILHELAANACKHGALSVADGRLNLVWTVEADSKGQERLRVAWQESNGPHVEPPAALGFGSRLIRRGITDELRGTVDLVFDPSGVRCTIEVPLTTSAPQ